MAKPRNSFMKLSGTVGNTVFVDSKAYGPHTRSPRGTFTAAVLNDTLQANTSRAALINRQAKRVHDLLKEKAGPFKESRLWQVMLKRLWAAPDDSVGSRLQSLVGLDLHHKYPLRRLATAYPPQCALQSQQLLVTQKLRLLAPPKPNADGWRCRLVLWLFDAEGKALTSFAEAEATADLSSPAQIQLACTPPANAAYWLCLLHLQACRDGQPLDTYTAQAMGICGAGVIG